MRFFHGVGGWARGVAECYLERVTGTRLVPPEDFRKNNHAPGVGGNIVPENSDAWIVTGQSRNFNVPPGSILPFPPPFRPIFLREPPECAPFF